MNIAFVGCMVLSREISFEISQSPSIVRAWWLQQGLHDTPDLLRAALQKQIDIIEEEQEKLDEHQRFQVICIGYGLCSNGVLGIKSRILPLVIPRCDDCISLFLGSATRYLNLFNSLPGIYWYNSGWIEQAFTPSEESYRQLYQKYVKLYGEDNADFLIDNQTSWVKNYKHCIYITSPVYNNVAHEEYAKTAAAIFRWIYHPEEGDMYLLHRLINGPWEEKEFLVCQPGYLVCPDYSEKKIKTELIEIG